MCARVRSQNHHTSNENKPEGLNPKQFCMLNDKKVIDYSIIAFEKSKYIDKIIIVVPKAWTEKIQKEIMQLTTNQKDIHEMNIQAEALDKTIKYFN